MKNLKAFKKKYQDTFIEDWGAYMSDQAKQFVKDFNSALKNELKAKGDYVVKIKPGHYYMSGFIQKGDKYVYLSYRIPRGMRNIHLENMSCFQGFLVRTAKNDKDFTGGSNNFTNIDYLISKIDFLLQ